MSAHSKGRQPGAHTLGSTNNTAMKVDGQDDDWEQGSTLEHHMSTPEHHVSKPWKKHHNKHKSQKVKHKMKRAIES